MSHTNRLGWSKSATVLWTAGVVLTGLLAACGQHAKVEVPDGSSVSANAPSAKKKSTSSADAKARAASESDEEDDETGSGGSTSGVADATTDNATPVSEATTEPNDAPTDAPAATTSPTGGGTTASAATPAPTAQATAAPTANPVKTYLACWFGKAMKRAASDADVAPYLAAVQSGEERRQQVAKIFGSDGYFNLNASAAKPWQAWATHVHPDITGNAAAAAWVSNTLSFLATRANAAGRTQVARQLLDKKYPEAAGVPPCS
jgi:hypothetical protein